MNAQQQILALGGVGILTERDITEFSVSVQRVFHLMRGGGWFTAEEIELAAGENGRPAREGLRRMRELRAAGFEIDRERCLGRQWKYRLRGKNERKN